MGNRVRDKSDGRDCEGAEVVDTYPKGDRDARRAKEVGVRSCLLPTPHLT